MSQQLSAQQLEHAVQNFEARAKAKTLECASLGELRAAAADVIGKLFNCDEGVKQTLVYNAVHNYLTAKLQQAVIELEELELQLKALRQMRSGIIVPGSM